MAGWIKQCATLVSFSLCLILSSASGADEKSFVVGGSAQYFNLLIGWNDVYSKTGPDFRLTFKEQNRKESFEALKKGTVDMILVERPVQSEPGLIQVPIALSAVAVVYNLPNGLMLKLKPEQLLGVLTGKFKSWNHPQLVENNTALKNVSLNVLPAFYIQPHGLSDLMGSYLNKVSGDEEVRLRSGVGMGGPSAVMDFVQQNPGAIGYVDLQMIRTKKLGRAELFNQAAQFVALENDGVEKASAQMNRALNGDFQTIVINPPGLSSYPLTFFVYAVTSSKVNSEKRQAMFSFLKWSLDGGDAMTKKVGLLPFPLLVRDSVSRYFPRAFKAGSAPEKITQ